MIKYKPNIFCKQLVVVCLGNGWGASDNDDDIIKK